MLGAFEDRVSNVLAALKLTANTKLTEIACGWQRKVALARAVTLTYYCDEPTNHTDVTIRWLEA